MDGKGRRGRRWGAVVGCAALALAACGKSSSTKTVAPTSSTAPAVSLAISSPADGIQIKGNVVPLAVRVSGLTIVKANGDTSGTTGHFHVFIDRDPPPAGSVMPKEPGIVHSADNPIVLTGFATGHHRIVVVVGDGAHRRIGTAHADISVDLLGPTVRASVPKTVPAGEAAVVSVQVQGVRLVGANGDTTGATGHLHLFVDRDPTPPGQPIPKGEAGIIHTTETTISIPNLAPGDHTVWVVLGDGTHVPFEPPVADKVTFTVA